MRALSTVESAIFGKPLYHGHVRVRIADADGTLRDYNDLPAGSKLNWVIGCEWSELTDQPVMTANVTLHRAHWQLSIAPLTDSKLNRNAAGAFARIIDIGRVIKIDAAVSASDGGPSAWVPVFDGHVFEVNWGSASDNRITVSARDLGGKMQDRFIESDKLVYSSAGGTAVQTVIQAVIDANMTAPDTAPTLFVPVSPGWNIRQYQQERMATLEAVRRLAQQIGWDVRYRWDDGTSSFRLTLYEPTRAAGAPSRTYARGVYFAVSQQRYSLEDIRNVIQVVHTEKTGDYKRVVSTVSSAPSITAYGRRFMEVSEASTSGIDTTVEALRMANAILDDLKEPRSYITLSTPMFYPAQLGDTIEIDKDGVTFDQAIKIVVYGLRHRVEGGQHTTEWTGRQVGGGYRDRWFEAEVRPGVAPRQDVTLDSNSLKASRNTNQSMPANSTTAVVFDIEHYDVGSNYNTGNGRYTAPAAGLYEISAGVKFLSTQPNTTSSLVIEKNAVIVANGDKISQQAASVDVYLQLKAITLLLAAGDIIIIKLAHDANSAQNVVGTPDTYLTVRRLRGG